MAINAYHPETGHHLVVDQAQLDHLRLSGWVALSEHEERQAAAQAAEAEAAKSAAKTTKNA